MLRNLICSVKGGPFKKLRASAFEKGLLQKTKITFKFFMFKNIMPLTIRLVEIFLRIYLFYSIYLLWSEVQ